jgi:hypothetical protein
MRATDPHISTVIYPTTSVYYSRDIPQAALSKVSTLGTLNAGVKTASASGTSCFMEG